MKSKLLFRCLKIKIYINNKTNSSLWGKKRNIKEDKGEDHFTKKNMRTILWRYIYFQNMFSGLGSKLTVSSLLPAS